MKFFNFKEALLRVGNSLLGQAQKPSDLEDIEEALYLMDVNSKAVEVFMETLKQAPSLSLSEKKGDFYKRLLKEKALLLFKSLPPPSFPPSFLDSDKEMTTFFENQKEKSKKTPQFWMFVGVNGVGKTTCIGKLAFHLGKRHKVLVIAGDTFRAAALQQLKIWSERAQVDFFSSDSTKDPSALAFQASEYAVARNYDFALLDTAGRMSHQSMLMEELKKIQRVIRKVLPQAPQEIFLVLDAHFGQNSLLQAQVFHEALSVTGVILNKLDGSAKGGIALNLAHELKCPIYWLGIGEKKEDLKAFHPESFVSSFFE